MSKHLGDYSKEESEAVIAYLRANGAKDDEFGTIERDGRYVVLYAGRGGVSVDPILRGSA